jgi:probable sporulation protein (polysaccharide deacetylase family)
MIPVLNLSISAYSQDKQGKGGRQMRYFVLLLGTFMIVTFVIMQNDNIRVFVAAVQGDAASLDRNIPYWADKSSMPTVMKSKQLVENKSLMELIKKEAVKRKIAPIDAKVDPVWKAIPAYNGLEVDIEQTLRTAESQPKSSAITYIMKETPPAILLEDLGPVPVYKGNSQKPMVSLMINVAWGNEFLPLILDTLDKEKVHATFFFDGTWLNKNTDTAKWIQKQGHELSNHAYSHKNMSQLPRNKAIEEIRKTQNLLKDMGVTNTLFAPPSGDFDQETVQIAYEMGLKTVLWTLDTVDWTNPGPAPIIQRITKRVEPGSLILMHPTRSSSSALAEMIHVIKQKNLTLGTVSELISPDRIVKPWQTQS